MISRRGTSRHLNVDLALRIGSLGQRLCHHLIPLHPGYRYRKLQRLCTSFEPVKMGGELKWMIAVRSDDFIDPIAELKTAVLYGYDSIGERKESSVHICDIRHSEVLTSARHQIQSRRTRGDLLP